MNWKRAFLAIGAVLVLAAIWTQVSRFIPSSIDYNGQKIKLTKLYLDYDDYKNDPDNIHPSETKRVQQLVSQAPIGHSFPGLLEAVTAVGKVKFPGYASGGFGSRKPDGDGTLAGFVVEIPRSENTRYFIFRCAPGQCVLLDDLIASGSLELSDFHRDANNLVYTNESGQVVLTRPILNFK
jgi:hypothetical protein